MEGTHLRRDAARPTHMLRENSKPLQNPKRNSLWHHHLAGRVLSFLSRSCPCGSVVQRIAGVGGGARTCAGERRGACLSAAARRSMERRCCITLRSEVMRRWWSSFWRRGAPWTRRTGCGESGVRMGEGWVPEESSACPLDSFVLCFSNLGFRSLPGLARELVTLLRCKRGKMTDSPANRLKEFFRGHL